MRNARKYGPRLTSGLLFFVWRTFCISSIQPIYSEDRRTTTAEAGSEKNETGIHQR